MNVHAEKAVAHFSEGCDCERAITAAFDYEPCECTGSPMPLEELRTGSTLGRPQRICGAVAGAARVIKWKLCEEGDCSERMVNIQKTVNLFMEQFRRENGSLLCKNLLGCDIRSYRGQFEAMEKGLCETECPKFIASAAEILDEVVRLP